MGYGGFIKLYRQLQGNPMWLSEPFSRGQAWVDMLLLANHTDGWIRKRGVKVEVKRGCLGWSERTLAKRWQWSRGKVRRFLDELKTEPQIEPQKGNVTSLIKIINYDYYQSNSTTNSTADGPQTDRKQYRNKNDKNVKNKKPCRAKSATLPALSKNGIPYQAIINHLNTKAGKGFRTTTKVTQNFIKARWNEGFRFDDFQKVIDSRCEKWLGNSEMADYLRPQTLFGPKFESYLNAATAHKEVEDPWDKL